MVVRNPLAGFGLTILGTLGLSFLAGIPILFLPQRELTYFYFPFALFGVGVFSGRTTFLGSLGFIGGLLGGIAGVWLFQFLFLPAGWPMWPASLQVLMTLRFGAACGLRGARPGEICLTKDAAPTGRAPQTRPGLEVRAKVR